MSKPDPRLEFTPRNAARTLEVLADALKKRAGLVVLSGEPGVGKTTTLKKFVVQQREAGQAVYMPTEPAQSMDSLLEAVCEDAGLKTPSGGDRLTYLYALRDHLDARLKPGDVCAIIADNGNGVPDAMLRDLALLIDLERSGMRPVQVVLTGNARLINRLNTPDFNTVRKEVGAVIKLEPFERDETGAYLQHCLEAAGYRGPSLFSFLAIERIHAKTRGVPRAINQVAVATLAALQSAGGKLSSASVDAAVDAALAASGPDAPVPMPAVMAPPVVPPAPVAPASEIVATPAKGGLVGQPQTMTVRMMLDKLDREFNPAAAAAPADVPAPAAAPATPAPSPAATAQVIADAADAFVFQDSKPAAVVAGPAPAATPPPMATAPAAPSAADLVADALAQVDAEEASAPTAPTPPAPVAPAAAEAKVHNSARQRLMARLTGR